MRVSEVAALLAISAIVAQGCGTGSAGGSTTKTGCSLPSTGGGLVRFVNAGTNSGNVDLCLRTNGTSDWGSPVLQGDGDTGICGSGLGYAQATAPFSVPDGRLDFKVIPFGSTCSAVASSETDGAVIGAATSSPVVTIVRAGGGSTAELLAALTEDVGSGTASTDDVRVVNALASGTSVTFGVAASPNLPTTIQTSLYSSPIPPGAAPEPTAQTPLGPIDASGYLQLGTVAVQVGIALSGQSNAAIVITTAAGVGRQTLFAIGDPNDTTNQHPVRGLYCQDVGTLEMSTDPHVDTEDAGIDGALLAACTLTELPVLTVDTRVLPAR